jgi:hypothetical protein
MGPSVVTAIVGTAVIVTGVVEVIEVVVEVVVEVATVVVEVVFETNVCVDVGFAVAVAEVVCVVVSVSVEMEVSVAVGVEETRRRRAASPGWWPHLAPDTAAKFRCCSGDSPATSAHIKHTELRPSTPMAFPQVHKLHSRSFSHNPRHVAASATRPT